MSLRERMKAVPARVERVAHPVHGEAFVRILTAGEADEYRYRLREASEKGGNVLREAHLLLALALANPNGTRLFPPANGSAFPADAECAEVLSWPADVVEWLYRECVRAALPTTEDAEGKSDAVPSGSSSGG